MNPVADVPPAANVPDASVAPVQLSERTDQATGALAVAGVSSVIATFVDTIDSLSTVPIPTVSLAPAGHSSKYWRWFESGWPQARICASSPVWSSTLTHRSALAPARPSRLQRNWACTSGGVCPLGTRRALGQRRQHLAIAGSLAQLHRILRVGVRNRLPLEIRRDVRAVDRREMRDATGLRRRWSASGLRWRDWPSARRLPLRAARRNRKQREQSRRPTEPARRLILMPALHRASAVGRHR